MADFPSKEQVYSEDPDRENNTLSIQVSGLAAALDTTNELLVVLKNDLDGFLRPSEPSGIVGSSGESAMKAVSSESPMVRRIHDLYDQVQQSHRHIQDIRDRVET